VDEKILKYRSKKQNKKKIVSSEEKEKVESESIIPRVGIAEEQSSSMYAIVLLFLNQDSFIRNQFHKNIIGSNNNFEKENKNKESKKPKKNKKNVKGKKKKKKKSGDDDDSESSLFSNSSSSLYSSASSSLFSLESSASNVEEEEEEEEEIPKSLPNGHTSFYLAVYRFRVAFYLFKKLKIQLSLKTGNKTDGIYDDVFGDIDFDSFANQEQNNKIPEVTETKSRPKGKSLKFPSPFDKLDEYPALNLREEVFINLAQVVKAAVISTINTLKNNFQREIRKFEEEEEVEERKRVNKNYFKLLHGNLNSENNEVISYANSSVSFHNSTQYISTAVQTVSSIPPSSVLFTSEIPIETLFQPEVNESSVSSSSSSSYLSLPSKTSSSPTIEQSFYLTTAPLAFDSEVLASQINMMVDGTDRDEEFDNFDDIDESVINIQNNNHNQTLSEKYNSEDGKSLIRVAKNVLYFLERIYDNDEKNIPLSSEKVKLINEKTSYINKYIDDNYYSLDNKNTKLKKNHLFGEDQEEDDFFEQYYDYEYEYNNDNEEIVIDENIKLVAYHLETLLFKLSNGDEKKPQYQHKFEYLKKKLETKKYNSFALILLLGNYRSFFFFNICIIFFFP
jgi:hypothetical protein